MSNQRAILLLVNASREEAKGAAETISKILVAAGIKIYTPVDSDIPHVEVVLVLGGDGTILRGAEFALKENIPLLGINLGHVGFMAEVEAFTFEKVAQAVIDKDYVLDPRMLLTFQVKREKKIIEQGWALNEISIERKSTTMAELFVQIDDRPLSRWGCDGIICATPTGSTAYAFSAGGPVVWPEVAALVLLPLSAHALFAKPMVISPNSNIQITLLSDEALLTADGFRSEEIESGDAISITKDLESVNLARLGSAPFADRLVAKFKLPVEGWRG